MKEKETTKKQIAILGSTGSIGKQALDIVGWHQDKYEVYALTAHNNWELLVQQAIQFQPAVVVIANKAHYTAVSQALSHLPIHVYAGEKALCDVVEAAPIDIVLAAMVGFAGLAPVINAIKHRKTIALANKETLVVAGELITQLAHEFQTPILPVDSEHSAIFQCLEPYAEVSKIILTASGGPFRQHSWEQLQSVTRAQALKHPNWEMGAKITIDSATMMNKGFEVIEARWLFNLPAQQIEVLVHPQSIVHSIVEFVDGAMKAQLGIPSMHLPIQLAFSYPERYPIPHHQLNLLQHPTLTFEAPDMERFRCLALAYSALEKGGTAPCAINAANEVAVAAFLQDKIAFLDIPRAVEHALLYTPFQAKPTYETYVGIDAEVRALTQAFIAKNL